MTAASAKDYLAKREIPQLFESLMTGLMYYRPEDHIDYLQNCLRKIKDDGIEQVKWNIFIESKKKTPLPPITPENGMRPARDPSFITDSKNLTNELLDRSLNTYVINNTIEAPQSLETRQKSPLPPIGQTQAPGGPERIALPNCPIVLVMGGPGSGRATQVRMLLERYQGWVHISMGDLLRSQILSKGSVDAKWGAVSQLVSKGELAPEELTIEMVKDAISKHMDAKGIIIEGFPRTMEQVADFDKFIGRCDLCFVLDCEEHLLQQRLLSRGHSTGRVDDNINAVAARLSFFKDRTLPAIKHFDDQGKVIIVDGDRDVHEIFYDLATLFDNVFFSKATQQAATAQAGASAPRPPSGGKPRSPRPRSTRYSRPGSRADRPGSGFANVPANIDIGVADTGRCVDMPKCPIILLIGGPGSGVSAQCQKIAAAHPGVVHISGVTSIEQVKAAIKQADSAKAIIMEGFPCNKTQVEDFNGQVGGVSVVLLVDCEEHTLCSRYTGSDAKQAISLFKNNVLPILGYYDDRSCLEIIGGLTAALLVDQEQTALWRDFEKKAQMFENLEDRREFLADCADKMEDFKAVALPVVKYIDDTGKLVVVNGDRADDEVSRDVLTCVQQFLAKQGVDTTAVSAPIQPLVSDSGRQSGLPTVPVVAIVGSPGCGLAEHAQKLADKASFTHVPMAGKGVADLCAAMKGNSSSTGFIVSAFPASKEQVEEFNKQVGGLTYVIVLDTDEQTARQSTDTGMVECYKQNTLPVLGYYDDFRKLDLVDVQTSTDVLKDMAAILDNALSTPAPTSQPSAPASFPSVARLEVSVADSGRVEGLPACKVVAVLGAPGSGFEAHVEKAVEKVPGATRCCLGQVTEIIDKVKGADGGAVLVLEGAITSRQQLEEFNSKVGDMAGVVVVDTSEAFNKSNGASDAALSSYKADTLPVLAHYDDLGKLRLVKGEDASSACEELSAAITALTQS